MDPVDTFKYLEHLFDKEWMNIRERNPAISYFTFFEVHF